MSTILLKSAEKFSVLASSTVTSISPTTVSGNLGVSPGTAVTGSPKVINGTLEAGTIMASVAHYDATIAYLEAKKFIDLIQTCNQ